MPKSRIPVIGQLNQLLTPTLQNISFWGANGAGSFTVSQRQMETYELSDGHDNVVGSNDAEAVFAWAGDDVIDAQGGDDWIDGGAGLDLIFGGAGDDGLYGGVGSYDGDTLDGGAGHDYLDGGQGGDVMIGGAGNDYYVVDHEQDEVRENANEGWDAVRASINYRLPENVEEVHFELAHLGDPGFFGEGNELANVMVGSAAADMLQAWGGNDELDGGAGADTLAGGSGDDVYTVDNAGDVVIEFANEGTDSIMAKTAAYTMPDHVEDMHAATWMQGFTGTGNALPNTISGTDMGDLLIGLGGGDTLEGGYGNDTLDGGDGPDQLQGGVGADLMKGGAGSDMYFVDDIGDVVSESGGSGVGDQIHTTLPFGVTPDGVEYLIYQGAGNFTGQGHDGDNLLIGQGGNDTLSGLNGNDNLIGQGGNDLLDGGAGADTMSGGTGNDTYIVDNAGDVINEYGGGVGIDTVKTPLASYTLPTDVEKLVFTSQDSHTGTGNAGANTITGAGSADYLYGLGGSDALYGQGGNDKLWGGDFGDTLDGGAGNDTLNGGSGNDQMNGGSGSDVFVYDSIASGSDVISGFSKGSDKINLQALDGDLWLPGNQAFTYVGKGAFAGDGLASVRWASEAAGAHVYVDANGDGTSDFDIMMMGVNAVSAADFLL